MGPKVATTGAAVAALCATGLAVAASAREGAAAAATAHSETRLHHDASRMLASHNAERERLGLPALRWNSRLERGAREWGEVLARRGVLQHADERTRGEAGENLWMGTAGHWDVDSMVGSFIAEKRHFRRGSFPRISRTGNWYDAGHYSQVVWRDTQEVGCSVVSRGEWDVLVCRYYPAGNVIGRSPY
ncbi:MAG: SCP-like extracellular [Citromicrobium sp.]|nr:MAG: SCP-like extracellular [Citromicrobium sp.]